MYKLLLCCSLVRGWCPKLKKKKDQVSKSFMSYLKEQEGNNFRLFHQYTELHKEQKVLWRKLKLWPDDGARGKVTKVVMKTVKAE